MCKYSTRKVQIRATLGDGHRYFISCETALVQVFLKHIWEHDQIENGLHWALEITFREDVWRIHKDYAPRIGRRCST